MPTRSIDPPTKASGATAATDNLADFENIFEEPSEECRVELVDAAFGTPSVEYDPNSAGRGRRGVEAQLTEWDRSSFVKTAITNNGTEAAKDPAFTTGPGIIFDLTEVAPILLEQPVLYSTSERMRTPVYSRSSGWDWSDRKLPVCTTPALDYWPGRCGTGPTGAAIRSSDYYPSPWIDTEFGVAIDRFAEFDSGDESEVGLNPYLRRAERARSLLAVIDADRSKPNRTVVPVPLVPDLIGICDVMAWMNGEAAVRYETASARGKLASISAGWRCVAALLAAQLDAIGRNEVIARRHRARRFRPAFADSPWGPRPGRISR